MSTPEQHALSEGWEVLHRFSIPRAGWQLDIDGVVARERIATGWCLHVVTTSTVGVRVDAVDLGEHRNKVRWWLAELDRALELLGQADDYAGEMNLAVARQEFTAACLGDYDRNVGANLARAARALSRSGAGPFEELRRREPVAAVALCELAVVSVHSVPELVHWYGQLERRKLKLRPLQIVDVLVIAAELHSTLRTGLAACVDLFLDTALRREKEG